MISVVELKKCVAGASIFDIIISKLCHGKKICPIILLKFDKNLEVDFYCTIQPFSLAICLQIKGN